MSNELQYGELSDAAHFINTVPRPLDSGEIKGILLNIIGAVERLEERINELSMTAQQVEIELARLRKPD